jgi:hypothetical protein
MEKYGKFFFHLTLITYHIILQMHLMHDIRLTLLQTFNTSDFDCFFQIRK